MSLAHQIMPAGEQRVPSLIRYDAACRALAEAKSVDDVKDIRDRSEAMRAYAKQAKNKQLEVDAAEIRIRAERRLGEMIAAQRDAGDLSKGAQGTGSNQHQLRVANGPAAISLAEAGIDKHLADRARKLAAIPEAEFTEIVADWRGRVERENERVSVNLLKSGERHSAAQASAITISEEDREYRDLQKAWDGAGEGARDQFLDANNLQFQAKASEDNGRITGEAGSVTGEASRVDAGRTVSATSETMDVTGGESAAANSRSDGDAFAAVKGKARLANVVDVEPSLSGTDPQKPDSCPAADKAEAPSSSPEASATQFTNPRCQKPDGCKWAHSQASCASCSTAWMKARAAA